MIATFVYLHFVSALIPCDIARAEVRFTDAYRSAAQNTEPLGLAEAARDRALEQVRQANAGLLPAISGVATYFRQDAPTATVIGTALSQQTTLKLMASQPLFRGFREFAGLRLTRANLRAQDAAVEAAQAGLLTSVGAAFYSAISAEQDFRELSQLKTLTEKRVQSLRERTRIGRSRVGEVLTAESQFASVQAQLEAARAAIDQARGQLKATAAVPEAETLIDEIRLPDNLASLSEYLARATAGPTIRSLRESENAAEENVKVAQGAHLPSVDLSGNYYLRRTGFSNQSKWDFTLGLTLPIFQGGTLQSEVRESSAFRREAQLRLGGALRTADADVRSRYAVLLSLLSQIRSLGKARDLAERNYQQQLKDYGFGLSNNLEVLQALTSSVDVRRAEARIRYTAKSAWIALEAAAGSAAALAPAPEKSVQ